MCLSVCVRACVCMCVSVCVCDCDGEGVREKPTNLTADAFVGCFTIARACSGVVYNVLMYPRHCVVVLIIINGGRALKLLRATFLWRGALCMASIIVTWRRCGAPGRKEGGEVKEGTRKQARKEGCHIDKKRREEREGLR